MLFTCPQFGFSLAALIWTLDPDRCVDGTHLSRGSGVAVVIAHIDNFREWNGKERWHEDLHVAFSGLTGMKVAWDTSASGKFDSEPLTVPGHHRFRQGAIHRLKLTGIPGRPGVALYPTLEIAPATPRTAAYLAKNAIPFHLTEDDLDQLLSGKFVTKVIYLPDRELQKGAHTRFVTLDGTRVGRSIDPVVEADRRGSILAIIRMGKKDLIHLNGVGDSLPSSDNARRLGGNQ